MPFRPLLRMARAWLGEPEPDAGKLAALIARSKIAAPDVPEDRRADWAKLLAGLETGDRTRAHVEGLVRACRMFSRPARTPRRRPVNAAPVGALDPVDRLPGLGPGARAALAEHGIESVSDLIWLAPATWDDLRAPLDLASAASMARGIHEASGGAVKTPRAAVVAIVKSASVVPIRGRRSVRVLVHDEADETCKLHAFWFFMAHGVLAAAKPGERVLLVGRIVAEPKKPPRMAHPEIFADGPDARRVRARYPRLGPPEAAVRKAIGHALGAGLAPDPVPRDVAIREGMPDVAALLADVHAAAGASPSDEGKARFVERLAWAEAFTRVWQRIAAERAQGTGGAPRMPARPDLVDALARELGFALTQDQRGAIAEIANDLAEPRPMRRLVLGDVGTGKTAVALAAAAQAVAAGFQVAILAPTTVLAEQYVDALRPLERAAGARVAFLASGVSAAARRSAEALLRSGEAQVAVGTHALLREGVAIPKLGLVVVDEQQRLGVAQRLSLVKKGERPHLLTLSATPIPRTLALALRGELATSVLRERPSGRPPVATELASQLDPVVARVGEAARRGERVFWIVPRVEVDLDAEEDDDPLASAIARRDWLDAALPDERVVLLHGKMAAAEKREAMQTFRRGDARVLASTTVVEVGVDVPEATLMVVENAERFGLAQLHQLRGRVGRGDRPGTCILLHAEPLEGAARRRLHALTELSSGEDVARADLELRGAGDLGGTRQHGDEEELLYLARGASHPWLSRVESDAREIAARDPDLEEDDHRVLRLLVARLGHDIAVREEAG
ncbi:MAG: DEAD/DEAH box helicase [Labilithrix sp.]|nr:DEAD/DEAH box helicase [Labilithrix sp.]